MRGASIHGRTSGSPTSNKPPFSFSAAKRPNAHVQLQGAFSSRLVILTLHYLMLGHNLMPFAPVCCNM